MGLTFEGELYQIAADTPLADAPAVRQAMDAAARAGAAVNLGEAWAGLHVLMTGELPIPKYEAQKRGVQWFAGSLENVLLGGSPTLLHTGFGPVCRLGADEVAQLAPLLEALTPGELSERYDPEPLEEDEIPPGGWDDKRGAWLVQHYSQLRVFFIEAARSGRAILVAIA